MGKFTYGRCRPKFLQGSTHTALLDRVDSKAFCLLNSSLCSTSQTPSQFCFSIFFMVTALLNFLTACLPLPPTASLHKTYYSLRPVLFIIYINDIDVRLNNFISKFANDTKLGNLAITDCNRMSLQEDLRKISEWPQRWEMPFNVNKCQILQAGTRNQKFEYEMNGTKLESVQCVRDIESPRNAKMPQGKQNEC